MAIDENNTTSIFEIVDYTFLSLTKGDLIGNSIHVEFSNSKSLTPLKVKVRIAISVTTKDLKPCCQITGQGLLMIQNRTNNIDEQEMLFLTKETISQTAFELNKRLIADAGFPFEFEMPSDEEILTYAIRNTDINLN
jgi:hypothetical protein